MGCWVSQHSREDRSDPMEIQCSPTSTIARHDRTEQEKVTGLMTLIKETRIEAARKIIMTQPSQAILCMSVSIKIFRDCEVPT